MVAVVAEEEISSRTPTFVALGCAQTLAWASSCYLLAILATAIARELGPRIHDGHLEQ